MTIKGDSLIQFVNLVNECCAVMEDSYVAEWLNKPHPDLNQEKPIDIFNGEGTERIYRLLYFIEKDEADLNG
tara:strand:+ start:29 stop:244 length:216 start_codon:yes stop_codon:yes gene_type:complete